MANPSLSIDITAQTAKFDKAMGDISNVADQTMSDIESQFAKFDPKLNTASYTQSITSMATSFGLVGGAVGGVITLVVSLNKSLADMADTADRVGLSFEKFQELKFGANSIGVSDSSFTGSIDALASKLQDAKFNENELTKLFAAQPGAIGQTNVKIQSMSDLISKVVDLIKRAPSLQDAIDIGNAAGIAKDFSQKIKESGDNFEDLAGKALEAGAVIDDGTVQKARDFDREWTKATANWSTNMRAALDDVLPGLNDAVLAASKLIQAASVLYNFTSGVGSFFSSFVKAPSFSGESSVQLDAEIAKYQKLRDLVANGGNLNPFNGDLENVASFQTAPGQTQLQILDSIIAKVKEARAALGNVTHIDVNKNPSVNPKSVKNDDDNSPDKLQRSENAIIKRTAALNAETGAIDLGAAAREKARIAAQLTAVAIQSNAEAGKKDTSVTAEQAASIEKVSDAYGKAAAALELAHSPLATFARQSADLDKQLNAFAAGSLNTISDDLASIVDGTKTAADAFRDMATSIIHDLIRISIQKTITGPIAGALFGGTTGSGGIASYITGLLTPNTFNTTASTASQLAQTGLKFPTGFADGGFTGSGGRNEPAGIVHRGEYVMDAATVKKLGVPLLNRLRGYADGGLVGGGPSGAGGVMGDIHIHNAPADTKGAQVSQSKGPDGKMRTDIVLQRAVEDAMISSTRPNGRYGRHLEKTYGVNPMMGRG